MPVVGLRSEDKWTSVSRHLASLTHSSVLALGETPGFIINAADNDAHYRLL